MLISQMALHGSVVAVIAEIVVAVAVIYCYILVVAVAAVAVVLHSHRDITAPLFWIQFLTNKVCIFAVINNR